MIGTIENAIIEELSRTRTAQLLGYKFNSVETYPENWAEYVAKDLIAIDPPCVWVTFGGFSPVGNYNYTSPVRATFGIIVAARNYRGQKEARHGGVGEVGSFQMVMDIGNILNGRDLGLEITGFEIGNCQYVETTSEIEKAGLSLLALQLYTEFSFQTLGIDDDGLSDFDTLELTWDLPPKNLSPDKNQTIKPNGE